MTETTKTTKRKPPAAGMLTPKRLAFCRELVATGNVCEAYRRAYDVQRMNPRTIRKRAHELMRDGAIRVQLAALRQVVADEAVVELTEVLLQAKRIAFSDIGRLFDKAGRLLRPHEVDEDTRAAIASFKVDEYGRMEYKFWDKNAALEKLFKHLGLYEKDNSQKPLPQVTEIRLVPLTADTAPGSGLQGN